MILLVCSEIAFTWGFAPVLFFYNSTQCSQNSKHNENESVLIWMEWVNNRFPMYTLQWARYISWVKSVQPNKLFNFIRLSIKKNMQVF